MFDVITVGSATLDVFAKTEHCDTIKGKKKEDCIAYPIGAKILIEELIISTGGGGTNTAASLSKLGHKVAFLGKIGNQENSQRLLKELKDYKVSPLVIRKKDSRTGYSVILDSIHHDRTILNYRGSNSELGFNEINLRKLKAKWLLFTALRGKSFRTQEKLAGYAKRKGTKVAYVLNPTIAKKGIKQLKKILSNVDIIIMNKEESMLLVGRNTIGKNIRKIRNYGPGIVAVTDGRKGAYVYDGDSIFYGRPNNVRVIETTGAGDAFASAFLSGIIKKNDVEFALKLGMTNSESVIQHHGAKNKLLRYKEALKIMKKRSIRVTKKAI
jgi:ribokinase